MIDKLIKKYENLPITYFFKESQLNNFERKISDDAKVISSLGQVIHKLR